MKKDNVPQAHPSEPLAEALQDKNDRHVKPSVNTKWDKVRSPENDSTGDANESIDEQASEVKTDDSPSASEPEEQDLEVRYQNILDQNKKLQAAIEELKRSAESTKLYHAAALQNERTKASKEIMQARHSGYEQAVQAFIPLDDSVSASLNYTEGTAEQYREGAQHILNQLKSIFEKLDITVIAPSIGDKFDPYIHTAAGTEVVDQKLQAPNTIVKVFQKGYKLQNRIIRPAMVTVSKVEENKT